jgi:hypothetical protein
VLLNGHSPFKLKLMRTIYFLLLSLVFISCSTKIRYIGKTLPATDKVDVYVDESSVKQPFEYIGKGYVGGFGAHNPEKIQKKSVQQARKNGADAVLIVDYYTDDGITTITRTRRSDTIGRSLIRTDNTVSAPTTFTGFNILFLKYNK